MGECLPVQAFPATVMAATCAKDSDRKTPSVGSASASSTGGTEGTANEKEPTLLARSRGSLASSKDMCRISDGALLACFVALCGRPALDRVAWAQCRAIIEFLCQCECSAEEVCAVLAHASKYFSDIYSTRGAHMGATEASSIMVVHAYMAHRFVLDKAFPLAVWHRLFLGGYCDLATLDFAVVRLMQLRKYKLGVDDNELRYRHGVLLRAATVSDPAIPPEGLAQSPRRWRSAEGQMP